MLKDLFKKKKIKTITIKWQKNTNLSTIESKKNKQSKQEEQRQNHGYGEHFDGCGMGGVCVGECVKKYEWVVTE